MTVSISHNQNATFFAQRAQNAGQTGQHCPFVVVGAVSALVHNVGKHQTSLQNVLAVPPNSPVAPVKVSTLMAGFTQYGQQCPGYSVSVKPAGHLSSGHSLFRMDPPGRLSRKSEQASSSSYPDQ